MDEREGDISCFCCVVVDVCYLLEYFYGGMFDIKKKYSVCNLSGPAALLLLSLLAIFWISSAVNFLSYQTEGLTQIRPPCRQALVCF